VRCSLTVGVTSSPTVLVRLPLSLTVWSRPTVSVGLLSTAFVWLASTEVEWLLSTTSLKSFWAAAAQLAADAAALALSMMVGKESGPHPRLRRHRPGAAQRADWRLPHALLERGGRRPDEARE